jgi:hypothetical protein
VPADGGAHALPPAGHRLATRHRAHHHDHQSTAARDEALHQSWRPVKSVSASGVPSRPVGARAALCRPPNLNARSPGRRIIVVTTNADVASSSITGAIMAKSSVSIAGAQHDTNAAYATSIVATQFHVTEQTPFRLEAAVRRVHLNTQESNAYARVRLSEQGGPILINADFRLDAPDDFQALVGVLEAAPTYELFIRADSWTSNVFDIPPSTETRIDFALTIPEPSGLTAILFLGAVALTGRFPR